MGKILIVSTDAAVAAEVVEGLRAQANEVEVVDTAASGLERAAPLGGPDLILLDRALVDADGGLLGQFLTAARSNDIPLLLLGGACGPAEWVSFLNLGVSAYVSLPVDADVLAARVGVFRRLKERLAQLRSQAVIDELTGIYNRRYLDEQLGVRLGEAKRY